MNDKQVEAFLCICETGSMNRAAEKLFISCFPAKETIAVYTALGCVSCKEHNAKKASEEPFDIQLEYIL